MRLDALLAEALSVGKADQGRRGELVALTVDMSSQQEVAGGTTHPVPGWLRLASIPLVAGVVLFGVWVSGALITDDEKVAKGLTALWFLTAGLLAVVLGWKWRSLAVPLIGTFVVVAGVTGGFLLYASTVDKVVNEEVVVADPPAADLNRNVEVASGRFVAGAHPTSGTARIIDIGAGELVLTLTDFATDPGPDLRVYVVPNGADGVDGGVDLGALRGNQGDQQYAVPKSTEAGEVVIWCRAFSVIFGSAALR